VDRHRLDADPDPEWHQQNDADAHADPTPRSKASLKNLYGKNMINLKI
jgi:hypothetical protein